MRFHGNLLADRDDRAELRAKYPLLGEPARTPGFRKFCWRIAAEAVRIAEERVRDMFAVTEFDPDEVHGLMDSRQAAEFLGLPYNSFREIAPSLPRHAVTPARFGYLRRELLAWARER